MLFQTVTTYDDSFFYIFQNGGFRIYYFLGVFGLHMKFSIVLNLDFFLPKPFNFD